MAKPGSDSAPAASLAHVLLLAKRDDSTQLQLRHSSSSSLVARVTTLENTNSELGLISWMFVTLTAPACSGPAFAVRGNSFIGMSKDATVPSAIPQIITSLPIQPLHSCTTSVTTSVVEYCALEDARIYATPAGGTTPNCNRFW